MAYAEILAGIQQLDPVGSLELQRREIHIQEGLDLSPCHIFSWEGFLYRPTGKLHNGRQRWVVRQGIKGESEMCSE